MSAPAVSSSRGGIWEEASSPAAARLAQRFEADWRAAPSKRKPDPRAYLPIDAAVASGTLLALLRAEMSLRREDGQPASVEWYRERYSDMSDEALVALIYEEFCLREEAGETPDLGEYQARFPGVADRLRRVLDIHGLVGSARSTALHVSAAASAPLPEAGQTIAGFYLVEELGRGAFARVFRAQERQLADRPVALKVARAGSREPQTLARLQHTHIVPVHSYRIDPATGLHLLCMPYLGGVTLSRLLDDVKGQGTRTGAELLAALDRLEPAKGTSAGRSAARQALQRRSYVRAIAWWGARLAEALQHAHEHGVLHRDVKPSNVLVTGDGLPMLLDFNLAWETRIEDPELEPGALGGTLAYMAPEHLEGLADGLAGEVDARSDIFSLGVVLYEAMGARPFAPPPGSRSVTEALLRAAEQRRAGPPRLREAYPEVPPEYEAVVVRCLAPDPADRYASAGELAADLQAVADDAALAFAREPIVSRVVRWERRNRNRLAVGVPMVLGPVMIVAALFAMKVDHARSAGHVLGQMRELIQQGKGEVAKDNLDVAQIRFKMAENLGAHAGVARSEQVTRFGPRLSWLANLLVSPDPGIEDARRTASEQLALTEQRRDRRGRADTLFDLAPTLRLRLLEFIGPPGDPSPAVAKALGSFYVLERSDWTQSAELVLLDEGRRNRLLDEVNDLLFLWAVSLDRLDTPGTRQAAARVCRRASAFAEPAGPWLALTERCEARLEGRSPGPGLRAPEPAAERSARACFQWSVLAAREARIRESIAWLDRATRLSPENYWYHYYLGYRYEHNLGDVASAERQYSQAVAVDKDLFWARLARAGVYQALGAWDRSLEDLQEAQQAAQAQDVAVTRLQLGLVHQALGDEAAARADYQAVVAGAGATSVYGRAARVNLARLDFQDGDGHGAAARYETLLLEDPHDVAAIQGRALLALRTGDVRRAEDLLARVDPSDPDGLALRAEARLARGRFDEARADAERALRLDPSPARRRLRLRVLLAQENLLEVRLEGPDDLDWLPAGGTRLTADLRVLAERLRGRLRSVPGDPIAPRNLAAVLAVLGESAEALAAADRAVAAAPSAVRPFLLRACLRRRLGDRTGARDDVARGLSLEPDDARLLVLRGLLATEAGDPRAALSDLDRARALGGAPGLDAARGAALLALDRPEAALEAWSLATRADPDDPRVFLGRARAFLKLHQWNQALADLERAASASGDRPELLGEVARAYAECLPAYPNRRARVERLARRAGIALSDRRRP
jgi:tetratricopeptide (TPR) repeat protein